MTIDYQVELTHSEQEHFNALIEKRRKSIEVYKEDGIIEVIINLIIDTYKDSAHFVYELLQNADDANAKKVRFKLTKEGLYFAHDGTTSFSVTNPQSERSDENIGHINSITTFSLSSKKDNEKANKIGKFGIGFKSVFQYTATPQIYNPPYFFEIQEYMIPAKLPGDHVERRFDETTLFYIPFNGKFKNKEKAYHDIKKKLETLTNPLLFLHNLQDIYWEIDQGAEQVFQKRKIEWNGNEVLGTSSMQKIRLDKQYFLLVSDNVKGHAIHIAFLIDQEGAIIHDREWERYFKYAYCFFPTKEETKLRFLIHAPFELTPNREGIKDDRAWNQILFQELGKLAANSLFFFKRNKLISDDFFLALPIIREDFCNTSYNTIYECICQALKEKEYLPIEDGLAYTKASCAYIAQGKDLYALLHQNNFQPLKNLTKNDTAKWAFKTITENKRDLWDYLHENEIIQDRIDGEKFARLINKQFLEQQSDAWLIDLYNYLLNVPYLYQKTGKRRPILLSTPIIRLDDGRMVTPFSEEGVPNAYLPTELHTRFPTIKSIFVENKNALQFFRNLGLRKPDLSAEVFHSLIPAIEKGELTIDEENYLEIFKKVLSYYFKSLNKEDEDRFISRIQKIPFIKGTNGEQASFKKPTSLFSDALKNVYGDIKEVFFVDDAYFQNSTVDREKANQFFRHLGVTFELQIVPIEYDDRVGTIYRLNQTYGYKSAVDYLIEDYSIPYLDLLIENISLVKSKAILDCIIGCYDREHSYNGYDDRDYSYNGYDDSVKTRAKFTSISPRGLRKGTQFTPYYEYYLEDASWLYDRNMVLRKSKDISLRELHPDYNVSNIPIAFTYSQLSFKKEEDVNEEASAAKSIEEEFPDLDREEIRIALSKYRRDKQKNQEIPETKDTISNTNSEEDTLADSISKGAKERLAKSKKQKTQTNTETTEVEEGKKNESEHTETIEEDDYNPPTVKLDQAIEKRKEKLEEEIAELTRKAELEAIVRKSEKYSFAWFKALLELENGMHLEVRSRKNPIYVRFTHVALDVDSDRMLLLSGTGFIPYGIEDSGELTLTLHTANSQKSMVVDVVSPQKRTLKAKLKSSRDIADINLKEVTMATVEVKNADFILENLINSFNRFGEAPFGYSDNFNFQANLPQQIEFVFGPPGTGKTTHIANKEILARIQSSKDLKILVLTPTNKAGDVLTEKLIHLSTEQEDFTYYDWLVRFGITNSPNIEESTIFYPDRILNKSIFGKLVLVTTIARFPYDFFLVKNNNPNVNEGQNMRFPLKTFEWDYVIFDEASMISLASISYVLYYINHHNPNCRFIVGGDPFQIAPVIQVDEPGWKDGNIYSMVGLNKPNSFISANTEPHDYAVTNLTKQWRCTEPLGTLFSKLMYNGALAHDRSTSNMKRATVEGLELKPFTILYFPVNKYDSIYKPRKLKGSPYHIYSAIYAVELIKFLRKKLLIRKGAIYRIGIICPYRVQQNIVDKILATLPTRDSLDIVTGTVHGFQGDECDMVVNLLNPPAYISSSDRIFLNKRNILNVSISRARDYLLLLIPYDKSGELRTGDLYIIEEIKHLIKTHPNMKEHFVEYFNEDIEQLIFGKPYAIENFSFPTTHQIVNVYTNPDKKYEIRFDEGAVDVQIK